ncbi:tol-pal system protein YbgF [Beijerinckia sp. L45]|uniref:tol-pal system protein YbgF n=1 Tax=Beijerinckia sp. L45 TaxID=1641855 RepID=UPI00131E7C72|nr:tol-pal system protein YbgF [Beijerinckia sp. L45]
MLFTRPLALAALLLPLAAGPVFAQQDYDRPPAGYQDDPSGGAGYRYGGPNSPSGGGADLGDPGAVSVRVGKLESRIREMTGQIEELQNANRRLVDQVTKFQADVDFRLQGKGGGAPSKHSDASGLSGAPMDADPVTPPAKLADSKALRRGDAFDPDAAPTAPGAPKPIGAVAATTPDAGDAPIDLSGGRNVGTGSSSAIAPTLQLPSATTPKSAGGTVTPNGTVIASIAPNSPKEEFDVALGYYKDKQYEAAEKGFTAFMTKNPKSKLNADATYYLGETYAQRGRQREAAEQYLKISTDYAQSARAPEAMLRLGVSLKALGAKEQACSAFTEIGRKYPAAPAYVKTGAEREAKRAQC